MAIISAGVVMNIIFAFMFAVVAYKLGVPYNPSIVSQTAPGTPAWAADIRPGDEVVKLGDVAEPSFDRPEQRASRWATWKRAFRSSFAAATS